MADTNRFQPQEPQEDWKEYEAYIDSLSGRSRSRFQPPTREVRNYWYIWDEVVEAVVGGPYEDEATARQYHAAMRPMFRGCYSVIAAPQKHPEQ